MFTGFETGASMIKAGDYVYVKYPEKSKWPDTLGAVQSGTLNPNVRYKVIRVYNERLSKYDERGSFTGDTYLEPSVMLELSDDETWGLSLNCVVKHIKVRNLPPWW